MHSELDLAALVGVVSEVVCLEVVLAVALIVDSPVLLCKFV